MSTADFYQTLFQLDEALLLAIKEDALEQVESLLSQRETHIQSLDAHAQNEPDPGEQVERTLLQNEKRLTRAFATLQNRQLDVFKNLDKTRKANSQYHNTQHPPRRILNPNLKV